MVNCAVGGVAFELTKSFSLVLGVDSRPELLAAAQVGSTPSPWPLRQLLPNLRCAQDRQELMPSLCQSLAPFVLTAKTR